MKVTLANQAASGRPLPYDELERERPPAPKALPPLCFRCLQGKGCNTQCPGVQADGSCLADKVRGRDSYTLEIDRDGFWCLLD